MSTSGLPQAGVTPLDERETAFTSDHKRISPPGAVFMRADDLLIVDYIARSAPSPVTVNYRFMKPNGEIVEFQAAFVLTGDGAPHSFSVPLTEGYLLAATVSIVNGGNTFRGQCFMVVSIGRLIAPSTFLRAMCLLSDYATPLSLLAWPGGTIKQSVESAGQITLVNQTNPAAGVDWTLAPALRDRWRLKSFVAQLATAAAVANRQVEFQLTAGGPIVFRIPTNINQAASLTWNYVLMPGLSSVVQLGTVVLVPLPTDFPMFQLWVLKAVTTSIQAADQWSGLNGVAERWIETGS